MIHQLRIYEIFEHNKAAFHQRFRDHAARIMRQYGFEIVGMWEAKTDRRTEFVYLLAWPDEAAKGAAWARFMASDEWKEIKRVTSAQYGDLVGEIRDRTLIPTDYSPPLPHSARACATSVDGQAVVVLPNMMTSHSGSHPLMHSRIGALPEIQRRRSASLKVLVTRAGCRPVAAEMNLSETAFLHAEEGGYRLRWFQRYRRSPAAASASEPAVRSNVMLGRPGASLAADPTWALYGWEAVAGRQGGLTMAPVAVRYIVDDVVQQSPSTPSILASASSSDPPPASRSSLEETCASC
jgi:heme-degrading monooxygenase HmoA